MSIRLMYCGAVTIWVFHDLDDADVFSFSLYFLPSRCFRGLFVPVLALI